MNRAIKVLYYLILAIFLFVGGIKIGRVVAIYQAELLDITEDGYEIKFGDEIHEYTFE